MSVLMENQGNKTIAVIGLGYVGLPLALLAERKGYKVIVDGRNCLPKEEFLEAGIVYKGIGR